MLWFSLGISDAYIIIWMVHALVCRQLYLDCFIACPLVAACLIQGQSFLLVLEVLKTKRVSVAKCLPLVSK